jgi:hypothetical protein
MCYWINLKQTYSLLNTKIFILVYSFALAISLPYYYSKQTEILFVAYSIFYAIFLCSTIIFLNIKVNLIKNK